MDNKFQAFNEDGRIYKRYRNLPHWEQPGCTYFVTFRLADSLPRGQIESLRDERDYWLSQHPKPWTQQEYEQYHQRFTERVEHWLDNGCGACVLRKPGVSDHVVETLHHFDKERYVLDEYTVMPNHVHALVKPHSNWRLKTILQSWRSYSGLQINSFLGRTGHLWMDEPFDHIVRSWKHLCRFRRYIRNNPRKAGLEEGEYADGKGSGVVLE